MENESIVQRLSKFIQNNKMKTVQSFFPTTTKSRASFKKQVTYKVMKKVLDDEDAQTEQNFPLHKFSEQIQSSSLKVENIFRDKSDAIKNFSLDQNNERPIGGMQLFRKMEKSNHPGMEESSRRLSKKDSRKNIKQSRDRFGSNQIKSHHHMNIPEKSDPYEGFKSQTFKQHIESKDKYTFSMNDHYSSSKSVGKYQSQPHQTTQNFRNCSTSQNKYRSQNKNSIKMKENWKFTAQSGKCSSAQSLRQMSEPQNSHLLWASEQQRNYLDKMAILNQINYNRPLIQKLGDRYFQGILRNRYMDEVQYNHKSPFIYQIKDKLSETKFISKLKSMKCNFMERNKIVLKGVSKMNKQQEEKVEVKDAKKRWDDWKQDSFQE